MTKEQAIAEYLAAANARANPGDTPFVVAKRAARLASAEKALQGHGVTPEEASGMKSPRQREQDRKAEEAAAQSPATPTQRQPSAPQAKPQATAPIQKPVTAAKHGGPADALSHKDALAKKGAKRR